MAALLRTGQWPMVNPAETMQEFLARAEPDAQRRPPGAPTTHRCNVKFGAGG